MIKQSLFKDSIKTIYIVFDGKMYAKLLGINRESCNVVITYTCSNVHNIPEHFITLISIANDFLVPL